MKKRISGFVFCLILFSVISMTTKPASAAGDEFLYAGTWTNLPTGGPHSEYSKGIYGWHISSATGELTSLGLIAKTDGPESLAASPNGHFLYATRHNGSVTLPGTPFPGVGNAGVAAYAVDHKTGKLELLNHVDARGDAPAHIRVDMSGNALALGNYYSGNVITFRILSDGRLSEAVTVDQHSGPSAHGGPHAHGVAFSPDNKILYVADQGIDRVYSYRFDEKTSKFTPLDPPYIQVEAGRGPRHLAVHPNGKWVYVNNEQGGTETFFESDNGRLKEIQNISLVPPEKSEGMIGAAESKISPDGKFLYANSRAREAVAVFSIDQNKGKLTMVQFADTSRKGNLPAGEKADESVQVDRYAKGARMFDWDATTTWVAFGNLGDNAVVILKRDAATGKLSRTGLIYDVPQPSYVVFVKPK
jgi:6-phosphogluconolactonase